MAKRHSIPGLNPDEVITGLEHEGNPKLSLAPFAKPIAGLPAAWTRALSADDPVEAVLDEVWKPAHDLLPKTCKILRRSTHLVGIVTTDKSPPALVYLTTGDGETYWHRGFAARAVSKAHARKLAPDFLALYTVHDGWLDQNSMMGWMPQDDWHPLGTSGPSSQFLVTFAGHGPASLGFDLEDSPPTCWTVWNYDKPERVKNVCKNLDDWFVAQYEDLDARATGISKPKAAAKPEAKTKPKAAAKPKAKTKPKAKAKKR
jgi:hypothetical protein